MKPPDKLHPQARAVVDVVLEALDIPYAVTSEHDETRARILDHRTSWLTATLRHLATASPELIDVDWSLAYLRERLAQSPPIGYVTTEQARERVEAGATWSEAVSLDYRPPSADEVPGGDQ